VFDVPPKNLLAAKDRPVQNRGMATLHLEYTCTDAELEEAKSLDIRQELGRGSKWRTRLVLGALVLLTILEIYVRVIREAPNAWAPYAFLGLFVVVFSGLLLWQRARRRARKSVLTRVEVTSADFTIIGPDSKSVSPWSAFGACLESPNLFVLVNRSKSLLLIVPKRAFPDENWQNWFRNHANNRPHPALQPAMEASFPTLSSSGDRITVRYCLSYWDFLDRALASWFTWGLILAIDGLIGGTFLYSLLFPTPDALPVTPGTIWLLFLPLLIPPAMCIVVFSILPWRAHAKHPDPQQLSLSEESVDFAGNEGQGMVGWANFRFYKETRRSFIFWGRDRSLWVMLPKRAFVSPDDVQRCRALLSRHLRKSRWLL
jgi:hypothetical protein